MIYTYAYPRPAVTVDIIVVKKFNNKDYILLIERKNPPFKNYWALPGGFVDMNEDLIDAAYRELKEETFIKDVNLRQYCTFGKPGRDPRGRTISIVFYGVMDNGEQIIKAGDDAKNAEWFPLGQLPAMAFDHTHIIESFIDFYKIHSKG